MTTYECTICLNINHSSKLHCSTCGTIPAQYSVLGTATRYLEYVDRIDFIPTALARGYDRAEWHHTHRVYLRTVKADYYAEQAESK